MERTDDIKKRRNAGLLAGLPGGFFIFRADAGREVVYADGNVVRLFGCATMEEFRTLTGNSVPGMVHSDDRPVLQQIPAGGAVRYRIVRKDGTLRLVEGFCKKLSGGGKDFYYAFLEDVTDPELGAPAELPPLVSEQDTDALTGMLSNRAFSRIVQTIISDPAQRARGISFIYFNISAFKMFNEQFGFQQGDELLSRVAEIVRRVFPAVDGNYCARLANDNFVVCTFVPDVVAPVHDVYQKALFCMGAARVEVKAGIYRLDDDCSEVGFACDRACMACNKIKNRYDVHFALYDDELRRKLRLQQYIIDHIDDAVDNGYIKVFYQPVVRVQTGEICGYEALARWHDPVHGMLSPFEFIDTLEQFHLIHKLDCFIVRKVCEDYTVLRRRNEPIVPVSVNLSRLDFQLCNVFDIVDSYRRGYDVPKEMLDIEITEGALNDTSGALRKEIDRFRNHGYQIWIDDFGSGYSSFSVLADYVFDVLKLDMKFLRSMDKNPAAGTLLYYIIYMAQEMGLLALTEGVETEEHYEFLKKVGCEKAQGYFFGKPQPLDETRAFTMGKGMRWEKFMVARRAKAAD